MVFSLIGKIVVLIVLVLVGIFYFTGFDLSPGDSVEKVEEIIVKDAEKVFVPERVENARARQIKNVYEKATPESLGDLEGEGLCDIEVDKDEILSNDNVDAVFTFDETLEGEEVNLWCDQFERFGISGDVSFPNVVPGNLKLTMENCDYGSVTTPTVYFLFATDSEDVLDYCVKPITVLPLDSNIGQCHSEETLEDIRNGCVEKVGNPGYTIPDTNGCDTVYCGFEGSSCPSENLLNKAQVECESVENQKAVRYSYSVSGQDWPCADVKCNLCPSEEDLDSERENCVVQGWEPRDEIDTESLCGFVVCDAPA
jgi:hypothetical protein